MIVDYIDAHRDRFGVEPICRVLSEHDMPIAPSTYYAHRRQPVSDADWATEAALERRARPAPGEPGVYGADKLATAMPRPGTRSAGTRSPG